MKKLETMGQRIRALRREKKLTQGDLAKIVGVSAPNVTGWEKDAYAPKADPLSKMAAYFGVSTSYITNGDESGPQLDNNAVQLNVLDIEAFKKKYNIPDSEDAVKFVQTSDKPFPIQKDMSLLKPIQRWVWMGISQIWVTKVTVVMVMFQLTQQDQEPMALKALATQCFQQFVMAGMLYATLMQILCRMSLFRCA